MRRIVVTSFIFASALVIAGLCVAALQWAEIGYRIKQYRGYGSVPYANHVSDGAFARAYTVDALVIAAGLAAVFLLRRSPLWLRLAAWCPLILNAAGLVTLVVMRHTGRLVEYGEFIQHMGP